MRNDTNNIQKSEKKWRKNLVVPNNCVNTHTHTHTHTQIVMYLCVRLFRKFFRLLSLNQNTVPPIFVGGVWCLGHAKFCFHKYPLGVPFFHKLNLLFLLGASSFQKGYFARSVSAFPLNFSVCLEREGVFSFSSRFKVQIFKESTGLLKYEPRTLNA